MKRLGNKTTQPLRGVQVPDQFVMPALNALSFRAVYFADDSGETASLLYLFMKTDDGSWKIKKFEEMKH